ncbi:MAG: oligosaccharide repeat unit polymerase [Bacteroidaceae bacterium]|nr:oligosaccharide repeat unit polymerase [Bacteroidaceae bacterium]
MGRNLSRPTILYVSGFFACAVVASLYKVEWGLSKMSSNTVLILVGGAFMFYLVELLDFRRHSSNIEDVDITSDDFASIKPSRLMLFLISQIFVFALMAKSQMSYAMTDDLSEAMVTVNDDAKFHQTYVKHPFYVQHPFYICMAARTLWCILLPFYLFKSSRYNWHKILLTLNFVVGVSGTLLTGGRTNVLYDIISLAICGYICYQYKVKWRGGLFPKKIMLVLVIIVTIFTSTFTSLGTVLGRGESDDPVSIMLSIYCGAEIKNLDDYVQRPFKQGNESGLPLQYTLCGMHDEIQTRFLGGKIETRLNQPDLRFNSYRNYPLGNVYTTYLNFILDFGFWGAIIFVGAMAWICSFLYRKSVASSFWKTGRVNLWLLFFVFKVPGACFLSFFANKFFEDILIIGTFRTLIYWWLLILFLQQGARKSLPDTISKNKNS